MKRLLKTTSLLSLIAVPFVAHAEGPSDVSNFSPRLKLQSRYSLYDTYRQNELDMILGTARFGMNYRYKNVFGVLEVQAGSASDPLTSATTATSAATPSGGTTSAVNPPTDNGKQNLFAVRRAFLGLDLVKSDPATVSLVLGRDHLTGSITYAPDAISQVLSTNLDNVTGAAGEDGLGIKYVGNFEFGKISAVLGSYNNMAVSQNATGAGWFAATNVVFADDAYAVAPSTQSRAILGVVAADIPIDQGSLEVKALYNAQPNAVTKVTSATSYSARDITNIEASIGYNYKKDTIKGGVWYQSLNLGTTQTGTPKGPATTNSFTYTAGSSSDSQTINTYGVGVVGNSKLWDMSGLLVDGDALTYAFGYQDAQGQLVSGGGGSTGVTAFSSQSLTTDIYNVGIGYQQGNFNLEFDYAMINANQAIYTNNDGVASEKSASIFYLVATLLVT